MDAIEDADDAMARGAEARRRGDCDAALEAYAAAEALGDVEATVATGVILEERGDLDGAEEAYRRGDDAGSDRGAWRLAEILEDRGDLAGAEAAYARGADRGSAPAAFALAMLHIRRDDLDAAKPVLRRAHELGHANAAESLERLETDEAARSASDEETLEQNVDGSGDRRGGAMLYGLARRLVHELDAVTGAAAQVAMLREEVLTGLREREREIESDTRAMAACDIDPDMLLKVCRRLSQAFPGFDTDRHPVPRPESWDEARDEWVSLISRAASDADNIVRDHATWSRSSWLHRWFVGPPRPSSNLRYDLDNLEALYRALPTLLNEKIASLVQEERERAKVELDALDERLGATRDQSAVLAERYARLETGLPRAASRWTSDAWNAVATGAPPTAIRIGHLAPALPTGFSDLLPPVLVDFPFSGGLAVESSVARRAHGVELLRSVVLRVLAAAPAGDVRLVFVDPVSLGQSVAELRHLADYDERLVDAKTWTSERDIERRLEELTGHLEVVISSYLRGQFETIDDYNRHAGAVAEPYVVLVVFDYPEGFTARSARHLLSLIENGPRCGVHTLLSHGTTAARVDDMPVERLVHSMQRVTLTASASRVTLAEPVGTIGHDFVPDIPPPVAFSSEGHAESVTAQILLEVGRAARTSGAGPVTLERVLPVVERLVASGLAEHVPTRTEGASPLDPRDPATWWGSGTAERAAAIIGQAGARDVASLVFSSTEIAGGAIMVGLPRSGKSTALHAAIVTLALAYPPDELELFLVDSKHGVEFKVYEDLPHARMVAIHSEREFSVAVLHSLDEEIARRAELMKRHTAGKTNVTEYRRVTGERMPRVVLVMDEFHEVFEEDDALGREAFRAFSNIVRQGPFAGVHVVVSSQTLSSMPAMDRSTLSLLPMRIAFTCNDADADLVMGDDNREVRALTEQGKGIYNPARGEPSRNKPFRGLYIEPDERERLLRAVREKADAGGIHDRPRVFDGDTRAIRPAPAVPAAGAATASRLFLRLGEPFDLGPSSGITLRRSRGANVVCVGALGDAEVRDDAVAAAVQSCVLDAARAGASVLVADFLGDDGGEGGVAIDELCRRLGGTYARGRHVDRVLADLAAELGERQVAADFRAPARLLVLHGLQHAIGIEPEDRYGDDAGQETARAVGAILRDGPDVGVHVVASVDSLAQFERRVGREALREFSWRVAGSTTPAKDLTALTEAYGNVDVRVNQLLLADDATASTRRVRGYPRVTDADVAAAAGAPDA